MYIFYGGRYLVVVQITEKDETNTIMSRARNCQGHFFTSLGRFLFRSL